MKVFAFVFARGGSKGLPGKNILPLAGRPLIQWSLDTAVAVDRIQKAFVSTDDTEIASVARSHGATVIERPPSLATDESPELLAWQHAVSWVQDRYGRFDVFVSLPATSPLRTTDDVNRCIDALDDRTDIVLTMRESERNPWFNMVVEDETGALRPVIQEETAYARRQDAPVTYDLTTVAYVARPEFILNTHSPWEGRVRGVIVSKRSAVDIDTEEDYNYARFLEEYSGGSAE